MKRVIKGSTFKNIDGYKFTRELIAQLNKLQDDKYFVRDMSNSMGYQIIVEGMTSLDELEYNVVDALDHMSYSADGIYDITEDEDYQVDGIVLACVQDESFVKLHLVYNYYYDSAEKDGIIFLEFDNGNVIFQDWYEDVENSLRL